jgi:hypothetical protein
MVSLELGQERSELLAFELVSHRASNEAREAPGTDTAAHRAREITWDADGELGCRLAHSTFLPW